jgi:hypothetical protein
VNGRAWQTAVIEEIVKEVSCLLVVDKDDSAGRRHRQEQVKEAIAFHSLIDE